MIGPKLKHRLQVANELNTCYYLFHSEGINNSFKYRTISRPPLITWFNRAGSCH